MHSRASNPTGSISRGHPLFHTVRDIEMDLYAMLLRHNPPPQMPRAAPQTPTNTSVVVQRNALGIIGIDAVVQKIGLPETGNTPVQNPTSFYERAANRGKLVTH